MVKRSIEQNLRMKNFEARNGNFETSAVVKNPRMKQREQRSLGECWQWKRAVFERRQLQFPTRYEQACKIDAAESFSEIFNAAECEKKHREPEVPEAEAQVEECLYGRARITSKELAPLHSVKSGILQNACSTSPEMDADLVKSARMHIVRLMNNLAEGPKRMVTKVQWLC